MSGLPDSAHRRAQVRRPCYESFCRLLPETEEDGFSAEVVDISPVGVGLRCEQPLQVGEAFILVLTGGPDMGRAVCPRAHVVHVTPWPDGHWLAGCVFTVPVPEILVSQLH
jgi:hypothetical protein